MSKEKPSKLGMVLFFLRDDKGTFKNVGRTEILPFKTALDVYANVPNPASQLIEGDDHETITTKADEMVKNMKDKAYVEEYVDPYL